MVLITDVQLEQLKTNGLNPKRDHLPVLKLFIKDANVNATWLISLAHRTNPDIFLALCDVGTGFPELKYISRTAIEDACEVLGLTLEQDQNILFNKPMSKYAEIAKDLGWISCDQKPQPSAIE